MRWSNRARCLSAYRELNRPSICSKSLNLFYDLFSLLLVGGVSSLPALPVPLVYIFKPVLVDLAVLLPLIYSFCIRRVRLSLRSPLLSPCSSLLRPKGAGILELGNSSVLFAFKLSKAAISRCL